MRNILSQIGSRLIPVQSPISKHRFKEMTFYTSPEYLNAVAEIYFRGKNTSIEDVRIGEDVLRLLVAGNKQVVTDAPFLDYHQPLPRSEIAGATRKFGHAKSVVRRVIEISEWDANAFDGFDLAPFVDWPMFATFGDYRAYILKRNKGLIKERERRGRRLAEAFGEIAFKIHDDEDDVLETARAWKTRQLRETGANDWFADGRTMEFLNLLRRRGLLTASTLRASNRLLAIWVGFIHGGVWSGWLFTYDPDLSKYSVGHQLLNSMLEESFKLKHREFDFSTGAEDYKMIYATHGRLLGPIGSAPLSTRLIGRIKKELRKQSPKLFEIARSLRRKINSMGFKTA
ncbi:MAG: GNAT family N-acetyltransferase [Rhodomicrobium sp.]